MTRIVRPRGRAARPRRRPGGPVLAIGLLVLGFAARPDRAAQPGGILKDVGFDQKLDTPRSP